MSNFEALIDSLLSLLKEEHDIIEKELNEYKAMVNLFDNKENELEEGKLNRITEKINKTK